MTGDRPRFDADRARAASARIRYNEIRDALEGVRVRAVSGDRSVAVDMGVGGAVLAIDLTDDAMRNTPQTLSRLLLETINSGIAQVAAMTNEVVAPYLSSADLNLAAITSGRLPKAVEPPAKQDWVREIEEASAIPKRPLGRYGRPAPYTDDEAR